MVTLLILVALGLQIGTAAMSGDNFEIWISPESFAMVGLPPLALRMNLVC